MGPFLLLRSPRARALAGLAIAVCGLAAAAGLHFLDGALYLLPPLLLAGAVLLGRYPGERALLALATRRARPPDRRQAVASTAPAPLARPPLPRGGRLIASFLAVRPPPGAACLQG